MWIFTNVGFFTVVENQNDKSQVILRARVRKDIEDFRTKYLPADAPKVTFHLTFDYPYRLHISKEAYAEGMRQHIMDIDYKKYKESVREKQGSERASFYTKLWSMLIGLEKDKSRINQYWDRQLTPILKDDRRNRGPRVVSRREFHQDEYVSPEHRNEYGPRKRTVVRHDLALRFDTRDPDLPPDSMVVHSDD